MGIWVQVREADQKLEQQHKGQVAQYKAVAAAFEKAAMDMDVVEAAEHKRAQRRKANEQSLQEPGAPGLLEAQLFTLIKMRNKKVSHAKSKRVKCVL